MAFDPGVQLPKVRRDARPQYTAEDMRERVEGAVAMQAVVKTAGRIGDLRVVRSLHRELDER